MTRQANHKISEYNSKFLTFETTSTLTSQELENYLEAQNRSVDALLAAFRISGDEVYLNEARANFPDHPQVLLSALRLTEDPARRLGVLKTFKRVSPENGIGNYLAAAALFDLGKEDEAFAELLEARGKYFESFMIAACQNDEEAYLSAGYLQTEAKASALFFATRQDLQTIYQLTMKLDQQRASYKEAGNAPAVQSVGNILLEVGYRLQDDPSIVGTLHGLIHEKNALKGLGNPEAIDRRNEIDQQRRVLTEIGDKVSQLMKDDIVAEEDWLKYLDRTKVLGEKAAAEWLAGKYPGS